MLYRLSSPGIEFLHFEEGKYDILVNSDNLMKLYLIGNIGKLKFTPNVGLEPTTLRLRVSCSTD